jgi:hypothetical protein
LYRGCVLIFRISYRTQQQSPSFFAKAPSTYLIIRLFHDITCPVPKTERLCLESRMLKSRMHVPKTTSSSVVPDTRSVPISWHKFPALLAVYDDSYHQLKRLGQSSSTTKTSVIPAVTHKNRSALAARTVCAKHDRDAAARARPCQRRPCLHFRTSFSTLTHACHIVPRIASRHLPLLLQEEQLGAAEV